MREYPIMTEPTGIEIGSVYAGFWWRALALFIDGSIIQDLITISYGRDILTGVDEIAHV
jgi:hypothetical protein